MNKPKIWLLCLLCFSAHPALGDCHYIKKDGDNYYYSNANGDIFDFSPADRHGTGLLIAGVDDKYNLILKHREESNVVVFFSCNNNCQIITESYVQMYGIISGHLVGQKQILRNPKTIIGAAMTDDINGCMEQPKKKASKESNNFFNDTAPSSATEREYQRLSKLHDGQG